MTVSATLRIVLLAGFVSLFDPEEAAKLAGADSFGIISSAEARVGRPLTGVSGRRSAWLAWPVVRHGAARPAYTIAELSRGVWLTNVSFGWIADRPHRAMGPERLQLPTRASMV